MDHLAVDASGLRDRGPSQAFVLDFGEPEDMARMLRSADIDYLSLAGAASASTYSARLSVVELGEMTFQHAEDDAHIARGVTQRGRHLLLLPAGPVASSLVVNGWEPGDLDAMLFGPGTEIRSVNRGRQAWAAIAFDPDASLIDERLLLREGRFATIQGLLARAPGLAAAANDTARLVRDAPERIASGSVARAMMERWSLLLDRALDPGAVSPARALSRRVRLVAAAEARLEATIGAPVYTHELANALGVSARTLHDAFHSVFGMSVHRYLHLRRLNLARSALRRGGDGAHLVKTVAIRYGFWHLGRFAVDYRAMFGEHPSNTLAAALRAPLA